MEQVHEKFKIFRVKAADGNFTNVFEQVEKFANEANCAPRSIGAEYLEASKELIVSLGYAQVGSQGNNVKLSVFKIGNLSDSNESLEKKIGEKARELKTVICQEIFITENNDVHFIFMANS